MKIKFGALVVAGSGKIGGHVVAKNRGGAYLRTKVTPLNPNTAAQAGARSLLASLATAWAGLTDEQRASWNGAVGSYASTDIFGDLRNPSGLNLYVKLNANLSNAGLATVAVAPEKSEIPFSALQAVNITIATTAIAFVYDGVAMQDTTIKIMATAPMSPGVSFVKSQLRVIGYATGALMPLSYWDMYVAKFGIPAIGQNIVFAVAPITATGQQGGTQKIKATIVA